MVVEVSASAPRSEPEIPLNGAMEAHCRRIAAWSMELEQVLGRSARSSEVIEIAEVLEESFEWEPFDDALEDRDDADPFISTALASLRAASRADIDRAVASLPVFPAAAQKALQLLQTQNWDAAEVASIAASDQVLAANIIRAANSWVHGARQPITTLAGAIGYIGAERAARILAAASAQKVFTSFRGSKEELRGLWNHSLESARVAEALAQLSRAVDPGAAFLTGLVHDIGRLAMALLPAVFQGRAERLLGAGCERSLVERALCGVTHAAVGALALETWSFDGGAVEAVRFHHQPERTKSRLASILYLTEHWTSSCEDLPSLVRLKTALDRVGLTREALAEFEMPMDRAMGSLRFAG